MQLTQLHRKTLLCARLCCLVFALATVPSVLAGEDKGNVFQLSEQGHFNLSLQPQRGQAQLGDYHNWVLTVQTQSGEPIYPAQIGITGGMPAHGHGLPSQPLVTQYLGDGRYLIEGVKFQMVGQWNLMVGVETSERRDRALFEVVVDYP